MGFLSEPPFPRGQTLGNTTTTQNLQIEGAEYWFTDEDLSAVGPVKPLRSGRRVRCRVVRNDSGVTLYPKRTVVLASDHGTGGVTSTASVLGEARNDAQQCYVVDEYLSSTTGVPAGDLFYVVVDGPTVATQTTVADATGTITVGDLLVAVTATTAAMTDGSTGGRVRKLDNAATTGVTAVVQSLFAVIGRALSTKSSASTNTDILINAGGGLP